MITMKFSFPATKYVRSATVPIIRGFGCLVLSVALGACSQASEQELLDRAHIAIEEGNTRAAEIDTRTALQQNPDNADARRLLGEIYLLQQSSAAAVDEFQRSLEVSENTDVRVLYAQALLAASRGDRLLELEEQNEFDSVRENPRYLAVLANAQAGGGELQNAKVSLAAALAAAPDDPLVSTSNALFLLIYSDSREEARTTLERVVEAHPDYADAWSLLGGVQQLSGEFAQAEKSYEKVVQINSYRFADRLNLITVRFDQGKKDEADSALQRMLASNPDHPGVNYLQGRMLVEAGENKEGLTALSKVLNVQPNHAGSLYLSAVANIAEGNYATARDQLDRLLTMQRDHVNGHLLLANLHLLMNNPAEAEQVARSLLQDNQNNFTAMGVLATALNAQGQNNNVEVIEIYQRMIEVRPDAVGPRLALGSALLQAGDGAGGVAQSLAARDLAPESIETWESLIQAQLARGDITAAKAEAIAYAERQPQNPRPHLYLARIALQENDLPGANAHYGEAEELLRQAIVAQPDNLGLQGLLIDTMVSQGKLEEADALLADLPEELAKDPAVLVARGRIALAGNRPAEAEPLLRIGMEQNPNTLTVLWLAGAIKAQGQDEDAIDLLKQWLVANPADALVHFELASNYMQIGSEQEAREHYQAVVESGQDNIIALNNLAWLQREDDPQQALINVEKANTLAPNSAGIMDTYAMVQLELGSTDEALSLNQRALDQMPDDPSLRYHRAVILHADSQSDEAIRILEVLVEADGVAVNQKEEAQTLLTQLQDL